MPLQKNCHAMVSAACKQNVGWVRSYIFLVNIPRKTIRLYRLLGIYLSALLGYSFNYIFCNYKWVHIKYSSEHKC